MSKNVQDFDLENLSEDDFAYFDQRPWLKGEYEMQTGKSWDDLAAGVDASPADGDDSDDSNSDDDGDEDAPADYSDLDFGALKAEIDRRNDEIEDDEQKISKAGSADDLRARLVQDDEALAEDADE